MVYCICWSSQGVVLLLFYFGVKIDKHLTFKYLCFVFKLSSWLFERHTSFTIFISNWYTYKCMLNTVVFFFNNAWWYICIHFRESIRSLRGNASYPASARCLHNMTLKLWTPLPLHLTHPPQTSPTPPPPTPSPTLILSISYFLWSRWKLPLSRCTHLQIPFL